MFALFVLAGLMVAGAAAGTRKRKKTTAQPQPQPQPQPDPQPEHQLHDITNRWAPFEDLADLQDALIVLGFDIGPSGIDGLWGAATQKGVREFQKYVNDAFDLDLREDGEPDAPTRTAISVGVDLFAVDQWIFPGESPDESPDESPEPEPYEPEPGELWEPDWDAITWSDHLFVAPDCSSVHKGMFWTSKRLNPRIVEAAKQGGEVFAEDILDDELAKDSPFCLDAGYDNWGPDMQQWYDDWVDLIYQDLELYAEHPELIGEYP